MITLHASYNIPPQFKGIVRDIRVLWALEELGLPYQIRWLDYAKGECRQDANRQIHPFGRLPSLEDGAQRVFESGAIVLYLYENAGKAPQDAHARAEVNQWCFAALNTMEPAFSEFLRWDLLWKDKPGHEWRGPEARIALNEKLGELDQVLKTKTYLAGGAFGPADILMTSVLDYGQHAPELVASHRAVRAYRDACHARPAYQRALAKQGAGPQANAA